MHLLPTPAACAAAASLLPPLLLPPLLLPPMLLLPPPLLPPPLLPPLLLPPLPLLLVLNLHAISRQCARASSWAVVGWLVHLQPGAIIWWHCQVHVQSRTKGVTTLLRPPPLTRIAYACVAVQCAKALLSNPVALRHGSSVL